MELRVRHYFLLESIVFPDRTTPEFYNDFNSHLLRSLGVVPSTMLLHEMFTACTYLPWAPFDDVEALRRISLPKGILSNWDLSLKDKLTLVFDLQFDWILGSAEHGVRKPDIAFFERIVKETGLLPSQIAYVGDSMRLDIEPALALGLHAVLIDRDQLYPHATMSRILTFDALETLL